MRIPLLALIVLLGLTFSVSAADLSGTWQAEGKPQRVLKVIKAGNTYRGELYNLGDEAAGAPRNNSISTITVSGSSVSFTLDKAQGTFQGQVSGDGENLSGTWKAMYRPDQIISFARPAKGAEWMVDPSPHKSIFVTVQPGVKLEVLDWGGSGRPLIFLSGLGGTAHEFDTFAPKFTDHHRVYAITRRGFGASSSAPFIDENYDADRLGDDVLAVMQQLKIQRPVLAGHSIAGGELSSVGTRHPDRIAGLIYLEALYQYAFHNPAQPDLSLDSAIVRRNLDRMFDLQISPSQWKLLVQDTQKALSSLQKSLDDTAAALDGPDLPLDSQKPEDLAGNKIFANTRSYGTAPVPVLVIMAIPRRCQPNCDKPFMQQKMAADAARVDLFEKSATNAKVVRIAGASHFIFRSNEADVLREMNGFMDSLPH